MKMDDEIRLRIMDTLYMDGAIEPNYSKIAKLTGYDIKTVRNSIFFLKKEGVLLDYIPFLDVYKLGFENMRISIVQLDYRDKEEWQRYDQKLMDDLPNYYMIYNTDQPGLMNRVAISLFRTGYEAYTKLKEFKEKTRAGKHVKDQIVVPLREKVKHGLLGRAAIDIMLKEKNIPSKTKLKYTRNSK